MVSLRLCALLSVSSLAHPSGVMVLFSSSVFVLSAVCLRRLCSLVPSRWGHPGLGRVSVMGSPTRSERRLSLLVSLVFLRDGVTLWVKSVLHTLLITIEGLSLAIGFCSFRLGSLARCFCLRLVFSLVGHHRLHLCSSYLLCVASFCPVCFLLLASFPYLALLGL